MSILKKNHTVNIISLSIISANIPSIHHYITCENWCWSLMLQQRKKNTHVMVSISTTLVAESRGNSHTTRTMHRKVVPDTNSWHWIFAYCLQIISSPIVPIVGKTLFVRLSRNYISFFFSLFLSLCVSVQFVQSCSCKLLLWWFNKDLRILKKIVRKKEPVMFSRLIVLSLFKFLLFFYYSKH